MLELPGIVHQRNNPSDLYYQFAVRDSEANTWLISNAIRAIQVVNVKGIVSAQGYKLIAYVSGGSSELYHLPSDPRERTNLLADGRDSLSDAEREALDILRNEIDNRLNSVR
ncbi:MAG: hypothetical protein JKX85_08855 [Phycisphaeraceae bacterium]|nr:hypothetical protein [Phycisphaeraceae bacterium]